MVNIFITGMGVLAMTLVVASHAAAEKTLAAQPLATATLAGGCFWCMQPPFDALSGVLSTIVGYSGGQSDHPTYETVSAGLTGHAEAVQIQFDPHIISYTQLLNIFWHNIDPTTRNRQFCDHGSQYRSAIFFASEEQKQQATLSYEQLLKNKPFSEPIVTEITPFGRFWPAEEYHQNYYRKNPIRYQFYRASCGRDQRLNQLWGTLISPHP